MARPRRTAASGAALARRIVAVEAQLDRPGGDSLRDKAVALADDLRKARAMPQLAAYADRLRARFPADPDIPRLQAQALVDQGLTAAARDVLRESRSLAAEGAKPWAEIVGLIGRVNKQAFVDARDRTGPAAVQALQEALAAYGEGFDRTNGYWHGGNLLALHFQAQRRGLGGPEPVAAAAARLVAALETTPEADQDFWWSASYAEAELGRGDMEAFQARAREFLEKVPKGDQFAINSFQRQLADLWDLDKGAFGPEGEAALQTIRGAGLRRRGATVNVSAAEVARGSARSRGQAARQAAEKTFSKTDGPKALEWWTLGLERARSVCAIIGPDGADVRRRMGTGFLVEARDAGGAVGQYVLTNAHVIGDPIDPAIASARDCSVRFEAHGPREHRVKRVAWTSRFEAFDATLLELETLPKGAVPLPLAKGLPNKGGKLYVIGHPKGDVLSFSFEDNRLLDSGVSPDSDKPPPAIIMVHYRTPTEPGSSGSPVFLEDRWRVVALHHAGDERMPRLNGVQGLYKANEGIVLEQLAAALQAQAKLSLVFT